MSCGVRLGCWISWLLSAWTDCFGCLHLVQVAVFDRCRWHTSWIWVGGLVLEIIFLMIRTQLQFLSRTTVNFGIDREGTAKSQDGQQKGTLAHIKRKVATVATALRWRWNLFKNIDINMHLLQFQPWRLASKILSHPYIFVLLKFCTVEVSFWRHVSSRFVGIRGAPSLTEACPRHAWQPQGCCACVGQAVVCRASSLHLSLLRQKSEEHAHRRCTSCAGSQSKSFTWFLCAF